MRNDNKSKYIYIAAAIALAGNAVLAALKITAGIFLRSGALVGDGIDSSTDVLISMITLAVVKILSKPADAEHPWGHQRAETIATAFLSFVIFFAGAQLIINSVSNLIAGVHSAAPSAIAISVTLISIAGKILLAYSQYILGKRADSAMIMANAKNMASDVLISLGVLIGFVISLLTGSPHADTIVAMLIGAWIIKTAAGIFLDANLELMDGNSDMESYRVIIDAVNSVEGASNPHRARMRRIAGFWDIDFDIDVDPKCTVIKAHRIATHVENEIKKRLENVFDIMIHIEPHGDDTAEAFGLSEDDMNGGTPSDCLSYNSRS
jgi:cation diffusion facilitator family transporter